MTFDLTVVITTLDQTSAIKETIEINGKKRGTS